MEEEWYIINDLDEFTDKVRAIVFNNFGVWQDKSDLDMLIDDVKKEDQQELDQILPHQESLLIVKDAVKKQTNRKTKKVRYTLSEKLFVDVIEKLNSRMVSNVLNSLVQKGLVDSAYDSESNDFVFWVKDNNKQ